MLSYSGWINIFFLIVNTLRPWEVAEASTEDWAAVHYTGVKLKYFILLKLEADRLPIWKFEHELKESEFF